MGYNDTQQFFLGDLYDISSGLSKNKEQFGSGYPFLSFKTVFNYTIIPTDLKDLAQTTLSEQNKYSILYGDVFLTRTSETANELGMSSVALKDYPQATFNGFTKRLRPKKGVMEFIDPKFIAYYLRSKDFRNQIDSISVLTTRASLNQGMIEKLTITVPNIETQKKIAAILSALDEKIAINREINGNLQQQAFALFDSLFPRTIDGSQTIGDYINPKRGRNLLSKDAVYGTVPVVAGGLEPSTYHNVANTKAPVLTISASGANAGFVNLWLNPVWSSDSSYIDSSMTPNVFFWYILLKGRQKEIFDAQTGSAQPHIYPQHIAAMPIGNLNQESVSQFTTQVAPLFELIGANKDENERLRNIRDALLPRLMSGEFDVTDICI